MDNDAARLLEVFQTDAQSRDAAWAARLDAAFWPTRLGSFTPHVVQNGASGFFSFRLGGNEKDGGEAATEPAALVDYALREDVGLVLWPTGEPQPLWAFSIGDVLSYRLYGVAYAPRFWNEPSDEAGAETIREGETVSVGSPSEAMFPPIVRHAVRRYMREKLGIRTPRVLLFQRPNHGSRLVFDLAADELGGEAGVARAFDGIAWHIPSCIPIYRIDSMSDAPAMQPF